MYAWLGIFDVLWIDLLSMLMKFYNLQRVAIDVYLEIQLVDVLVTLFSFPLFDQILKKCSWNIETMGHCDL
uniref:Uncharacterized protein n=1 Tax=Rhizophora mucronata TaxID=61149 RepID=A0A2P2N074_RHIMU